MNTVAFGRTVSANYQSKRVEIQLEVLEGWTEAETLTLAKAMVDRSMGLHINRRKANKLYQDYYGTDTDINDMNIG